MIRGGNRQTFNIRASAQQNGLIRARAHIVTADGQQLGAPLELDIRAAQYGTVGLGTGRDRGRAAVRDLGDPDLPPDPRRAQGGTVPADGRPKRAAVADRDRC